MNKLTKVEITKINITDSVGTTLSISPGEALDIYLQLKELFYNKLEIKGLPVFIKFMKENKSLPHWYRYNPKIITNDLFNETYIYCTTNSGLTVKYEAYGGLNE